MARRSGGRKTRAPTTRRRPRAALEPRKLLADPEIYAILVGDGHSIFGNARARLLECLVARDEFADLLAGMSSIQGEPTSDAAPG